MTEKHPYDRETPMGCLPERIPTWDLSRNAVCMQDDAPTNRATRPDSVLVFIQLKQMIFSFFEIMFIKAGDSETKKGLAKKQQQDRT